ncbi:dihydrolipoamide acetyltransferase family protein [Hoeflea sp.]|uniref:dihydrolipoamide acetyltransferase family protein n=1 Tax=Hoeflea sp. TaxID=1940281 RepID=UPI003A8D0ABB
MGNSDNEIFVIRMPDVGEGIAEAELVEWHAQPGDMVREDDVIAAVMTDKATVEIPSSITGKVIWLGGKVGDMISVGSDLVRISPNANAQIEAAAPEPAQAPPATPDADPSDAPEPAPEQKNAAPAKPATDAETHSAKPAAPASGAPARHVQPPRRAAGEKPLASPAIRRRALEAGVDLRRVSGSGPAGRLTHADLDAWLDAPEPAPVTGGRVRRTEVTEIPIIGLRRAISRKLGQTWSKVPHITIVEEIDVTALEELRAGLNVERKEGKPRLTILPFLVQALVRAVADQPDMNAHHDDEAGQLRQFAGVHVGIATQTPQGLKVPVVRHAESRSLDDTAIEIARVAEAARDNTALRDELSGSTITITSLGALGAIATTPLINAPETAIVGVNKMAMRPVWDGAQFVPRKIMNLSSSFDHRVIDGWDAAIFVKRLKTLLETPALIFVEG